MLPDCKPVKGKVPGPAEHLLCATHGHVVDVKEKKIIAVNLDQYKSKKMGAAKPAQAAAAAQGTPPPGPTAATAAPAHAPLDSAATSNNAGAAKSRAEVGTLLDLMQSETEDFESVRAAYENLAGGGRVNRAVSWVSDAVGGADDPGDDLAKIGKEVTMEHVAGMAAAGTLDLSGSQKHLATMKALNEKAHRLWKKYAGDTVKGAERTAAGLTVVSKVGDVATAGLNVVAPGWGKALSVVKNLGVTGSNLAFGEKVNWTDFTVDMAFDLFVGKRGPINASAKKIAGPLAKKLAPKLTEAIVKKWGLAAVAKKLGGKVTDDAIDEYIVKYAEERIKEGTKDLVMPIAEYVVETAKDSDITHEQLVDLMLKAMTDPAGQLAISLSDRLNADFKP